MSVCRMALRLFDLQVKLTPFAPDPVSVFKTVSASNADLHFYAHKVIQNMLSSVSLSKLIKSDQHMTNTSLSAAELSRVIEMAWEDRTPFEAIYTQFGLSESQVIALMRRSIKQKTFNNWRARVSSRKTKHLKLRPFAVGRGYCSTQYKQ